MIPWYFYVFLIWLSLVILTFTLIHIADLQIKFQTTNISRIISIAATAES